MPYLTTTSIITLEETHLTIKKVKTDPSAHYWLHSLILLSIVIYFQAQRAINTDPLSWGVVLFLLLFTYPHLEKIYKLVFTYQWGNTIQYAHIKEIVYLEPQNELETPISIKLVSGRQKILTFRTAENQADLFVAALQSKTSP